MVGTSPRPGGTCSFSLIPASPLTLQLRHSPVPPSFSSSPLPSSYFFPPTPPSSKAPPFLRRPAACPPRRRRCPLPLRRPSRAVNPAPNPFLSESVKGRESELSPFHLGSLIADLIRRGHPLGLCLVRLPIPSLRLFPGLYMEESLLCNWGACRAILAILQWWGFNVTVIIMNKWIFQNLDFKFPLTVSCVHFICSAVGAYIAIKLLKTKPLIEVDLEDRWKRILPMSFVFCINIVLGNVSLRYIPVSFMQTIKSFTPATTVVLQWLLWRKYFDCRIWTSLIPIVGGILLTSVTELSFNIFGFCAAMFGCLATSTKTILAESLLHGYKFDSINTVYYMAPFATMILALPAMLLEGSGVINWFYTHPSICSAMIIILSSGVLAFCLNFSIFYVIHSTTAVTFNVAGNLKVAVAVLISWLIFKNPISAMNAVGCAVTLSGCTFYGYVRHKLSQQQPGTPRTPRTPRTKLEMLPLVNDKQDKV